MNKEELKALSERIIKYRAKHNLSTVKFAELCNLTFPTVCNIQNCKQMPSKITLQKILNIIE